MKQKQRQGIVRSVGTRAVHTYEDRDGVRTCTGMDYQVTLKVEVADGPDAGRWVVVELDPDTARHWAESMTNMAHRADELNQNL